MSLGPDPVGTSGESVTSRRVLAVAAVVLAIAVGVVVARGTGWTQTPEPVGAASATPSATSPGGPTAPPTRPVDTPPEPGADITLYAHPPISYRETSPDGYIRALEDRSSWADGLFLYYPARLAFGARPEIDALQEAYPEGIPLTVSAKNADAAGLAEFRDQLTPQQAALTLWERWQEPADDFTTPAERAEFRALVEQDIETLRPAGIRVGVHEQCWTLDPENRQSWAGEQSLRELIPPDVDIVTATCLGGPTTEGAPPIQRFLDFMAESYPGVDVGFTSLAWSVPAGTPEGSPVREERAAAARAALEYAVAAGVTELGWFDFADWDGKDYDAGSDPALLEVLRDVSAGTS